MKIFMQYVALAVLMLLGQASRAATVVVTVGDNFYSPQQVTIHPGDVVTWQYQGGTNPHPTASDNGAWTTFTINTANVTKSLTFNTAGAFPYHCEFHGAPGIGMYGVITVSAALAVQPAQLAAAAFSVYPNPARGPITLLLDHSQARDHNVIQLLDPLGRQVRTIVVRREEAGHELAIDVADLPTGIYYCRLLVDDRVVEAQRLSLIR